MVMVNDSNNNDDDDNNNNNNNNSNNNNNNGRGLSNLQFNFHHKLPLESLSKWPKTLVNRN